MVRVARQARTWSAASVAVMVCLIAPAASAAAVVGPPAPPVLDEVLTWSGLDGEAPNTSFSAPGVALVDGLGDQTPDLLGLDGDGGLFIVDLKARESRMLGELSVSEGTASGLSVGSLESEGGLDIVAVGAAGDMVRVKHGPTASNETETDEPISWTVAWHRQHAMDAVVSLDVTSALEGILPKGDEEPLRLEGPPVLVPAAENASERGTILIGVADGDGRVAVWDADGTFEGVAHQPERAANATGRAHGVRVDIDGDGTPDHLRVTPADTTRRPWDPRGLVPDRLAAYAGTSGEPLWRLPLDLPHRPAGLPVAGFSGLPQATVVPDARDGVPGLAVVGLADGSPRAWTALPTGWVAAQGPLAQELDGDGWLELVVPLAPVPENCGETDPCDQGAVAVYQTRAPADSLQEAGYRIHASGWSPAAGGVDAQSLEDTVEALSKIPFAALLMMLGGGVAVLASLLLRFAPPE